MTATLLIYDPTAPTEHTSESVSPTLDGLAGKVIGFIDNAKPNFHYLVDDLAEILGSRHGVAAVVKRAKRGPSIPAARAMIDELAAQCDLVIAGSGD